MKKLVLISLTIFLMSGIWSCGARKTQKTEISESETNKQTTEIKENTDVSINVKKEVTALENKEDSSETEVTTITPIDGTKPAYFNDNGKIYNLTNAYFKKERSSKIVSKIASKKIGLDKSLSKIIDKSFNTNNIQKTDSKVLDKQSDRKPVSFWWFLIPMALLVIIILIWKKYKDSFWFV